MWRARTLLTDKLDEGTTRFLGTTGANEHAVATRAINKRRIQEKDAMVDMMESKAANRECNVDVKQKIFFCCHFRVAPSKRFLLARSDGRAGSF